MPLSYETMIVSLPSHYVLRRELLDQVKVALLNATSGLVLHGPAGSGKTTTVHTLCQDPDICTAFPDGIFWMTLGQGASEFSLRTGLRRWIEQLGGIIGEAMPSLKALQERLADLLWERACLLVVDDIWTVSETGSFRLNAPRCRLLLTSPEAGLAQILGLNAHPIPAMSPDEAITLLERWAEGNLTSISPEVKLGITRKLGSLPLPLKLAGAQLQRVTPVDWLKNFDSNVIGNQAKSISNYLAQTSLVHLNKQQRRLYSSLSIFNMEEAIPFRVVARLWAALADFDKGTTLSQLDALANQALLHLDAMPVLTQSSDASTIPTVPTLSPPSPSQSVIRLDAPLRDYLVTHSSQVDWIEMHRTLLDTYCPENGNIQSLKSLPDDGYLYDHLAYHLDQLADQNEWALTELGELFCSPDWLHARVTAANYTFEGYLADMMLAWQRANAAAQQQIEDNQPPTAIASCVRYALIRSSINALAGNYPPALVARAVALQLWPVEQALRVAARLPSLTRVVETMATLLDTGRLSALQREQAQKLGLAAAMALDDEGEIATALGQLAPFLSGVQFGQTVNLALELSNTMTRAAVLTDLAIYSPEGQKQDILAQALAAVLAIRNDWGRAKALRRLAPHLTDELLIQALATIQADEDTLTQEDPWREIAMMLSQNTATQERAAVLAAGYESARAMALGCLALHLSNNQRQQALSTALAAAQAIQYKPARILALVELIPHLPAEQRQSTLEEALIVALAIDYEPVRANALRQLAPHLSGELTPRVLAAARAARAKRTRADLLGAVLASVSGQEKVQILSEALAAALAITTEASRADLLHHLGPHLIDDYSGLLIEALEAALALKNASARYTALIGLLSSLGDQQRQQALAQAVSAGLAIKKHHTRANALTDLAPRLTGELKQQTLNAALTATLAIDEAWMRDNILSRLAPQFPDTLLKQALAAIPAVKGEQLRPVRSVTAPAPASDERLPEALENVLAVRDKDRRVAILGQLVPHLSGELKQRALTAALDTVLTLRQEWIPAQEEKAKWETKADADGRSLPLSGVQLNRVLAAILTIEDEWDRARSLSNVAPQLPGKLLSHALEAILAIGNKQARVMALHELAPHLSDELKNRALIEALEAALAIRDNRDRAEALGELFPHLSEDMRQQVLSQALDSALAVEADQARASVLAGLALQLTGPTQERALSEALTAALTIDDEEDRTRVLNRLLPLVLDRPHLIKILRRFAVDHLLRLGGGERAPLLRFLWAKTLFNRTIVSTEILEKIAETIIEISIEWEWL